MHSDFTLDQLTTFAAVVEEGSFSAAGRRLGRVQSAVSYAIAQLEDALGSTLFERTGRRPVLTEAGRRLAAETQLVLAQTRELTEAAARLRTAVEPSLRVSVDALYPSAQLVEVCVGFRERFGSTSLRIDVGLLSDVVAMVDSGAADLGACNLANANTAQLSVSHLGMVRLVPVCAPHHALATEPAPHSGALLERFVQMVHTERGAPDGADQGVLASRTWRVSTLTLKSQLIRAGLGWGSLPEAEAVQGLVDGSLVQLHPAPWPEGGHRVSLHAVHRRDRALGPAGQWFREQLMLAR